MDLIFQKQTTSSPTQTVPQVSRVTGVTRRCPEHPSPPVTTCQLPLLSTFTRIISQAPPLPLLCSEQQHLKRRRPPRTIQPRHRTQSSFQTTRRPEIHPLRAAFPSSPPTSHLASDSIAPGRPNSLAARRRTTTTPPNQTQHPTTANMNPHQAKKIDVKVRPQLPSLLPLPPNHLKLTPLPLVPLPRGTTPLPPVRQAPLAQRPLRQAPQGAQVL